jgi:hypothetical protein
MPRLTVDLSDEIDKRLTEIAKKECISKAEAMRKAFALLSIAIKEKANGNSMGIIGDDENHKPYVIGKVIGV